MTAFELSLRTVTPAFCRGADASAAELRPPSLKGQLRWWYRAWHPLAVLGPGDGPWAEGRVMGGTEAHTGQCPFLLRVFEEEPRTISWQQIEQTAPRGSRTETGGIRYLGFAFREIGRNDPPHNAIAENVAFKVVHHFPRREAVTDEVACGLIAAWWLLTHLGGIGARSRRGFGSLVLDGWSWPGQEKYLDYLPVPSQASTARGWQNALMLGLDVLRGWRGSGDWPDAYPQPYLGSGASVVVQTDTSWRRAADALEQAGKRLAAGRREHRGDNREIDGRVTVGLPLVTGRQPTTSWRPGSWRTEPIESDIHASPLHLHVGAYGGGFGLIWTRLAGPVPGLGQYRVQNDRTRGSIREQAPDTLDALVGSLMGTRWTAGSSS
jgi:CRISPR-associated protein Cmr1